MGECELIDKCPFFNGMLSGDEKRIEEMKEKYCRNNNLNCARYMIANALGKEKMPPDLFPNEKERAYKRIAED
jgi:hypothetical protein